MLKIGREFLASWLAEDDRYTRRCIDDKAPAAL